MHNLDVLQMLSCHQTPSRCRPAVVVPTITSAFAVAIAPFIAVYHRCCCVAVAVEVIAAAVAVAIAIATTTTARFC